MATNSLNLHSTGVSVNLNNGGTLSSATQIQSNSVSKNSSTANFQITINIANAMSGIAYDSITSIRLSFKAKDSRTVNSWANGSLYGRYYDASGNLQTSAEMNGSSIGHNNSTVTSHSMTLSASQCIRNGEVNLILQAKNNQNSGSVTFTFYEISIVITYVEHSHSYSGKITKQPTCTSTGIKTYSCPCGDSYTETLSMSDHTEVKIPAVSPTCISTGLTEGKKCSVCETIITPQQIVPKIEHSYTSVVTPPTDTLSGYTTHTCSVCGDTYKNSYVHRIIVKVNNNSYGTVIGAGDYADGKTVTLTAISNEDCIFVSWNDGTTKPSKAIIVTGNATYTAYFKFNAIYVDTTQSSVVIIDTQEASEILVDTTKVYG
jgi:hypothetical protein